MLINPHSNARCISSLRNVLFLVIELHLFYEQCNVFQQFTISADGTEKNSVFCNLYLARVFSSAFSIYAVGVDWRLSWDFPLANPWPHPRPDPRVWPLMWPWVCLRKIPWVAFNLPLGHRLRTLGTAPGHKFTWLPPRLVHILSHSS